MTEQTKPVLYGYSECAEVLGVATGTLYNRSSQGKLPFEPVDLVAGRTLVFDRAEVEACRHLFKPTRLRAIRSKAKAASKSRT